MAPTGDLDEISVRRLAEPTLQRLHAYWQELAEDGRLPRRADVDPVRMPRQILSHLMLTELVSDADGRRRYRYRLVGSGIVERAGRDPTWEYLDDCLPAQHGYRDYLIGLYDTVVEAVRPVFSRDVYVTHDPASPPELGTKRLMLPLADSQGQVSHVLSGQTFEMIQGVQPKPFLAVDGFRPGDASFVVAD